MEVVFVRHGHGEHLLDYPNQLNMLHPGLTLYGESLVNELRGRLLLNGNEQVVVSPTKRTIETARILLSDGPFVISPLAGPRMFPQDPSYSPFVCDQIYSKEEIRETVPDAVIVDFGLDLWEEGINRIGQEAFETYGRQLLDWCKAQAERVIIVSHDGTITNYRMLLGEQGLTRKDFLGEAGVYQAKYE
ncbi:histidine phosphatase family protein [Paenibacillus sp. Y412MC10]|uniref:histidine phosphatase family protein n=1 Tax=Geobacillus sp. (strain Y412MC10) TaxID=481743 RepID=UPI0011AB5076|nr:histidine phosphatase family protein [Paenibacillus sp. Y412MC10]